MELAQFKLLIHSVWHEAFSSWSRVIRRSPFFFLLPAFFATLIVVSSSQVAYSQLFQPEENKQILLMQKRNQIQGAIQLQRLIRRQQLLVAPANLRQIRVSIDYSLAKEQLPAVNRRIEVHLLAQKHWIDHHCQLTSEQNERFDDMIRSSLKRNTKLWDQNFFLPTARDLLPVTFVIDGMGQKKINTLSRRGEIGSFLTNTQVEKLIDALREHEAWLRSAVRDHAYTELDKLFYFTPKQRPLVEQHLDGMISKSNSKCFSISNKKSFFPYGETFGLLAGLPHEQLSPSQAAMLKLKRSNLPRAARWSFLLSQSDSPEEFNKKLDSLAKRMREELLPKVMVRFDCLSAFLDLSPAAARRLEVAAKGAVHYKVNESKTSALQSYRNAQARMNNVQVRFAARFSVTFPRPEIEAVLSHPIIQEIEIDLEEEFESYFKVIAQNEHKAQVTYLVSLLDRELWLTQTQRAAFHEMIANRLAVQSIDSPDGIYEIVLIAFPLATISDEEIGGILDQSQLTAWKELKTHFQFSDDPSVDNSASLKLPRANGKIAFKVPASVATPASVQPVEAIRESDPSVP